MDRSSVRLGNIAGVPVGVSWTLLVLALVFTVGLAEGRLPASDPGYAEATYWIAALVTVATCGARAIAERSIGVLRVASAASSVARVTGAAARPP